MTILTHFPLTPTQAQVRLRYGVINELRVCFYCDHPASNFYVEDYTSIRASHQISNGFLIWGTCQRCEEIIPLPHKEISLEELEIFEIMEF